MSRPGPLSFLFVALGFTLVAQRPAQVSGGALRPDQACFDVQHYALRIRVHPEQRRIDGRLVMDAVVTANTTQLALHLDDAFAVAQVQMAVRSAGAGGSPQPIASEHERRPGLILVHPRSELAPGDHVQVTIGYRGKPRVAPRPPWQGGFTWAKTKSGAPWIATSCQGEGADLWWPCKDHPSDKPASMDLDVRVPADLVCASNGTLAGVEEHDDETRTFSWRIRSPISNYCVALNIAPYERIDSKFVSIAGETVPVQFYVLPENRKRAQRALPEFLDHLRFFEERCGPYPFRHEKYGIVETPHLGMEHQTIIAYGNRYRKVSFDYDWLHHHELAHEWWGNLVTCRDWKDMWIHEGIGTYMQALYIEERHGPKAYRTEMETKRRSIANRRPIAPTDPTDSVAIYFGTGGGRRISDSDIYFKGSWVCHSLRYLVGDPSFAKILRRWAYPRPELEQRTDGSQVRLVDTDEIVAIAEKVVERDLGWFFDAYLRVAALPRLVSERVGDELRLRWEVPGERPFPMPVPVRVDGRMTRVEMTTGEGRLTLAPGAEVVIDPDAWLLRER